MKKILLALAATATIAGGTLAASSEAEARPYGRYYGAYRAYPVAYGYRRYGYYPRYYRRNYGGAVAAGVAGALIGGALAASAAPAYGYYGAPAYSYGYPAYGYAYPSYGYRYYGY
ncbi:MAG TPA: hypothetical protein VKA90_02550 [Beijerinckiaceae bacterium]|jgi:hypothetical protein|nr:hypothetical protein [Beijerinckiaceae bacterium]